MSFAETSASWKLFQLDVVLLMRLTVPSMIFRLYSFGAHARKDNNMRPVSVGLLYQAVLSFPSLRSTIMSRNVILISTSLSEVNLRQGCRLLACDMMSSMSATFAVLMMSSTNL